MFLISGLEKSSVTALPYRVWGKVAKMQRFCQVLPDVNAFGNETPLKIIGNLIEGSHRNHPSKFKNQASAS